MSHADAAILKGSKNQENAYKFIDYLLREDVMAKIIEGYPYKNVNAKADNILPSSYISNTSSNFSKDLKRRQSGSIHKYPSG